MDPSGFADELHAGNPRAEQLPCTHLARHGLVRNDRHAHADHDEGLENLDAFRLGHDLWRDVLAQEELVDGLSAVRAWFEQDERLTDNVARGDLLLTRERVSGRRDEQEFLAHDRHAHQVWIVHGQRQEPQVCRSAPKLPEQALRRAGHQLHVHIGMVLAECLQQRRKHVEADRHSASQAHGAADRLLAVEDAGPRALEILEHALAQPEKSGAGRRNPDLAAKPQEHLLLQLLFEQQNLTADGRLRQVQLLPGARERSRLRDGAEYFELSEVHLAPVFLDNTGKYISFVHKTCLCFHTAAQVRAWRKTTVSQMQPTAPSPDMTPDAMLRLILNSRVYDVACETPLDQAHRLSRRLRNQVLLKREDLQPVFSYKLRGAYNRMAHLTAAERAQGVIAASAGNHAQGVAFSARHLGVHAVIVMPKTTPAIKVEAVGELGAEVVLSGDTYNDAKRHCDGLAAESGRTFVHPFDDPLVIAGQGTVGQEILRHKLGEVDAVFVPVGGGGLIAGIASYVKALRPGVEVIGVEPYEADAMFQSLAAGRRITLDRVGIFADGVAVQEVGRLTFPIVRSTVREIVRVSNDEICAAIKDVFDDTRSVVEPAGALAVAGLRAWVERTGTTNARLAAVLSGANMNFDRLRFVAERAELGEAREALFGVTIPERSGAFREFCASIGRRVVTEFNYRLSGREAAHIFVGIATRSRQDADDLAAALNAAGYRTVNLSDNELAKLHVRHMVGGRSGEVRHERVHRFEFPERPGALMDFLEKLGGRWNISLFHYRNHGADFGRVLAGFEVPEDESAAFDAFVDGLGYPSRREERNAAYDMFLA